MPALLLGSIGSIAETSHLQLAAFNAAFREAGLDWHWSEPLYREMLKSSGGKQRVAAYAAERGDDVNAAELHRRKGEIFRGMLADGVPPRAGVAETLEAARAAGWQTGVVETTSSDNLAAVLAATGLAADRFDVLIDKTAVHRPKPDPECYAVALARLGLPPDAVLAVEDNPPGLDCALAAGVPCIAFPGAFHDPENFSGARAVVDRLAFPERLLAQSGSS